MAKSFKNINSLNSYLNQKIQETMASDVFMVVKNVQRDAIEQTVYNYQPRYYDRRRMQSGGLTSEESFHKDMIFNGNKTTMRVSNIAKRNSYHGDFSGGYLTPLIVYGHEQAEETLPEGGYSFSGNGYSYLRPRDFVSKTRNILKREKTHAVALEFGLIGRGLKVKS